MRGRIGILNGAKETLGAVGVRGSSALKLSSSSIGAGPVRMSSSRALFRTGEIMIGSDT